MKAERCLNCGRFMEKMPMGVYWCYNCQPIPQHEDEKK